MNCVRQHCRCFTGIVEATIPSQPSAINFGWSIHSLVRILYSTLSICTYLLLLVLEFLTLGIFMLRNCYCYFYHSLHGIYGYALGIVEATISVTTLLLGFRFQLLSRVLLYHRCDNTYAMSGGPLRAVGTAESIVASTILACRLRYYYYAFGSFRAHDIVEATILEFLCESGTAT